MGVYIKGMEMPTDGSMIFAIRPDGMVEDVMGCYVGKAVPVPPHGRLINADALCKTLRSIAENEYTPEVFANWIENHIDVIIEADGVEA